MPRPATLAPTPTSAPMAAWGGIVGPANLPLARRTKAAMLVERAARAGQLQVLARELRDAGDGAAADAFDEAALAELREIITVVDTWEAAATKARQDAYKRGARKKAAAEAARRRIVALRAQLQRDQPGQHITAGAIFDAWPSKHEVKRPAEKTIARHLRELIRTQGQK